MSKVPPLIVIDIVGLTASMLGKDTPNLNALIKQGQMAFMNDVFPAVTTTAQTTMLTGKMPSQHGIVGNGWYFRSESEVRFWPQSNNLVQADKVWHHIKASNPEFTCSKLFWWYNMYADVTNSITPRPHYPADGRKVMGLYSDPAELQNTIETEIGEFPFFNFWGPKADITSSRWIVNCAIEEFKINQPNLQLVYLPHLDYNLQRLGPSHPDIVNDIKDIDTEAGRLIDFGQSVGADIMVVSEYGVTEVSHSISLNRLFRQNGLLKVRDSLDWELLDPGASRAFAVADHQIAHIYIKNPHDVANVKSLLISTPGVEQVLDSESKVSFQINHARSGELIVIAEPGCWFDYYYWLDDAKAPDFARTVDIHRKPGYDPAELFLDPSIHFPKLKIVKNLIKKKVGMRMLMDVIPITSDQVKGSHGRKSSEPEYGPLLLMSKPNLDRERYDMTDVFGLISKHFS